MTQDLETVMKNALDGKFFSFDHNGAGGMKVLEKEVSKDFIPKYNFTMLPLESGSRSGLRQVQKRRERLAVFWTPPKVDELLRLRALNHSARRIGRTLGVSRLEVGKKLNSMGILSMYGKVYHDP